MSEDDNQVPSALVSVGTKALAVRSASLVKRGLALANSLARLESGLRVWPEEARTIRRLEEAMDTETIDAARCATEEALSEAHASLGYELMESYREEAILQFREALRLNPNNDWAHNNLGVALGQKGDTDGAVAEYREALRLNPNLAEAHCGLAFALWQKGDWDGMMAEEREALRLDPNLAGAHRGLGLALGHEGDWDGAIAEYREALRLNPSDDTAHYNLGLALEHKHEPWAALEEYRTAYEINPQDPDYRKAYERLEKETRQ